MFAKTLEKLKHISVVGVFSISLFSVLSIYNCWREFYKRGNKFSEGNKK